MAGCRNSVISYMKCNSNAPKGIWYITWLISGPFIHSVPFCNNLCQHHTYLVYITTNTTTFGLFYVADARQLVFHKPLPAVSVLHSILCTHTTRNMASTSSLNTTESNIKIVQHSSIHLWTQHKVNLLLMTICIKYLGYISEYTGKKKKNTAVVKGNKCLNFNLSWNI